jgi:hypothetical protein
MATNPTPQDIQEPSAPLTPEQKRKNAAALAKQKADEKKPINPDVSQEPTKMGFGGKVVDAAIRGRLAKEAAEKSGMKGGGKVKCYAKGGSVSSASKRADGCATKGKTRCRTY